MPNPEIETYREKAEPLPPIISRTSPAPFADTLYSLAFPEDQASTHPLTLTQLQPAVEEQRALLRWMTTRFRSPYIVTGNTPEHEGSGWGGYYLGHLQTGEEAYRFTALLGHLVLAKSFAIFGHQRTHDLLDTVLNNRFNPQAIQDGITIFETSRNALRTALLNPDDPNSTTARDFNQLLTRLSLSTNPNKPTVEYIPDHQKKIVTWTYSYFDTNYNSWENRPIPVDPKYLRELSPEDRWAIHFLTRLPMCVNPAARRAADLLSQPNQEITASRRLLLDTANQWTPEIKYLINIARQKPATIYPITPDQEGRLPFTYAIPIGRTLNFLNHFPLNHELSSSSVPIILKAVRELCKPQRVFLDTIQRIENLSYQLLASQPQLDITHALAEIADSMPDSVIIRQPAPADITQEPLTTTTNPSSTLDEIRQGIASLRSRNPIERAIFDDPYSKIKEQIDTLKTQVQQEIHQAKSRQLPASAQLKITPQPEVYSFPSSEKRSLYLLAAVYYSLLLDKPNELLRRLYHHAFPASTKNPSALFDYIHTLNHRLNQDIEPEIKKLSSQAQEVQNLIDQLHNIAADNLSSKFYQELLSTSKTPQWQLLLQEHNIRLPSTAREGGLGYPKTLFDKLGIPYDGPAAPTSKQTTLRDY